MSKTRAAGWSPAGRRRSTASSRAAAVGFFALLPIAVALGVVVGRSDSGGDEEALLKALRQQNSGAVAAAPRRGHGSASTDSKAGSKSAKKAKERRKATGKAAGGKVVAKTKNGTVHQVTGYSATQARSKKRHQAGRRKPRTDGRKLHQGPAEPARRDRRSRANREPPPIRPRASAGAAMKLRAPLAECSPARHCRRQLPRRRPACPLPPAPKAPASPNGAPGAPSPRPSVLPASDPRAAQGRQGAETETDPRRGAAKRPSRSPEESAEPDRPAGPAAGEVHDHAGRPRRRLLRDGDP